MTGRVMADGRLSDNGQAGYCPACQVEIAEGDPDACLGWLPGVSHACCGHGDEDNAYVVIGGEPNECCVGRDWLTLRGVPAATFFGLIEHAERPQT